MAANPCDELQVDLSRVDVNVDISGPPCIDVDWVQADIVIESLTVANQGPKGDKGDPGEDGESIVGPPGPPGSPGTAASVDAGTTTTGAPGSAANVVNSGSSSTAVFDFTIPRGDVGATGPMGQGILIKGSVPNHASLPTTGNTPGDVWVTSDTSHGWAWNGTAWVDIGPIQGPPGAVGPSGPAGSDGAPGAAGAAGAAATVAAGTTTTSAPGTNAAVINTGSSSAAVFAFTIPRGDVGAAGPAGAPGGAGSAGAPGAAGGNAWTLVTNASFTVPAYGANVTVQAGDTSWVALGEWVYVDDAGGPGVAGQLVVTAKTPTTLTLFNPTATTYPLASTSVDGLLRKVSGNTTDFIDGTNNCQAIVPQITSVRLRSYNSVGNSNFEVDQRTAGAGVTMGATNAFALDRWFVGKVGTLVGTAQGVSPATVLLPGTNFQISRSILRVQVATQQASLAAGDYCQIGQFIEGPNWRELSNDVHSLSLLVRSTVAGLNFGVSLRDPGAVTKSLTKLCTISSANTWTLITLPNLPVWPGGNFTVLPGNVGYLISITLAAGATWMSPVNDTWQAGNFLGAAGQNNFFANPVSSYIDIAFCQHEPGPCTTLMDKPFSQNLDECLRYFCKSYPYSVKPGTATNNGALQVYSAPSQNVVAPVRFPKILAKISSLLGYSLDGTLGSVHDDYAAVNRSITGSTYISDGGFGGITLATTNAAYTYYSFHYTADTGW